MIAKGGIRRSNAAELAVLDHLWRKGYHVIGRGWPDFIAIRGKEVRFIEVKRDNQTKLKPVQKTVAKILKELTGIDVEMLRPRDVKE